MVLYTDIIKSITKVLKDNFKEIKIYGDEVMEGYKTPCFFVGIYPISHETVTKNYIHTRLLISISYFSDTVDSVKNYMIVDKLRQAFGIVLTIGERHHTIQNVEIEKVDSSIFEFSFSINYLELINFEKEREIMKELHYIQKG